MIVWWPTGREHNCRAASASEMAFGTAGACRMSHNVPRNNNNDWKRYRGEWLFSCFYFRSFDQCAPTTMAKHEQMETLETRKFVEMKRVAIYCVRLCVSFIVVDPTPSRGWIKLRSHFSSFFFSFSSSPLFDFLANCEPGTNFLWFREPSVHVYDIFQFSSHTFWAIQEKCR